jgi:uncharacterized membrane protein
MSIVGRLDALERRLDAIEKRLGVASQAPPILPIAPPIEAVEPVVENLPFASVLQDAPPADMLCGPAESAASLEEFVASPEFLGTPPEPAAAPSDPTPQISPTSSRARNKVREFLAKRSARIPVPPPSPPPQPRRSSLRLEREIGLKWSGWIGAIVLVIGAAMGVQFAFQNHWLELMSPGLRLAMIFAAGVLLLGAGELVLRWVHQVPAASLFGAGVAVLFLGSYAGHAYFDLYTRSTSVALMGASTLIGSAVAMRGNLVSVAVLSLIGANVAPLLVATPNAPVLPFLFYLLMMLIVALALAAWGRGGKWWVLRGLSLCPTVLWMWQVLEGPQAHDSAVLGFMILFAVLYHVELIVTTIRHAPNFDETPAPPRHGALGTTFALCVTAALALGLLDYLSAASDATRAGCAIVLSLISAALGFALPRLDHALRRLALSHRIAAAGLLVLALPLYTGGVRLEIGWMLMGLGFALSWAFTGSRIARPAAPITWSLGLAKLFLSAGLLVLGGGDPVGNTWLVIWSVAIGSNITLAGLFALCGQLIAALILRREDQNPWQALARSLSAISGCVWILAAICGLPHLGATGAIIAYAWVLVPLDRIVPELGLATQAATCLFLATAKWAAVDTVAARLSPDWPNTRPVFNTMTGVGILAAASLLGFHRLAGASARRGLPRTKAAFVGEAASWNLFLAVMAIVLLTVSFSFEIDRIVARTIAGGWTDPLQPWEFRQLSFTILWSISIGAIALVVGRRAIGPLAGPWRNVVWLLVGLLAIKFVFVDTVPAFTDKVGAVRPILNLQVIAGMAIVACLVATHFFTANVGPRTSPNTGWGIGLAAALLVAYTGTLEIDRAITRCVPSPDHFGIAWHIKNLAWDAWWTLVASATLRICRRLDKSADPTALWLSALPFALGLIAAKYVFADLIFWRHSHLSPSGWSVLLNWDDATGAVVLTGVWQLTLLRLPPGDEMLPLRRTFRQLAGWSTLLVLLVVGMIEIDRAFTLASVRQAMRDAALAEQVALSIYLAAFAIVTVAIGFWKQTAALRYAGLTLLGAALLKIVIVDMSQVRYGYRVLSFLGLGAILLIVSVMYGKISPQLIQHPPEPSPHPEAV